MKITPALFEDTTTIVVAACGFAEAGYDETGYPQISPEARIRALAGVVLAGSEALSIQRIIASGGLPSQMENGSPVDESEATGHFLESKLKDGPQVIRDPDCNTTETSARSVGDLLRHELRDRVPSSQMVPVMVNRAFRLRAGRAFENQKGITLRCLTAERVLKRAALFGWSPEDAKGFAEEARKFTRSKAGITAMAREALYTPVAFIPGLGAFAERLVSAWRTAS